MPTYLSLRFYAVNPSGLFSATIGASTVSGNVISGGSGQSDSSGGAQGSALISIRGPVARIEIVYDTGGTARQMLHISDVRFSATTGADNDLVDAGAGNDYVASGLGHDTVLAVKAGSTMTRSSSPALRRSPMIRSTATR